MHWGNGEYVKEIRWWILISNWSYNLLKNNCKYNYVCVCMYVSMYVCVCIHVYTCVYLNKFFYLNALFVILIFWFRIMNIWLAIALQSRRARSRRARLRRARSRRARSRRARSRRARSRTFAEICGYG
jgi:high-affinity K+ transport system ATPase subunit B